MTQVESAIHDFVREHAEAETRFLAEIVKVPSDNPPGDCGRPAEVVATLLEGLGFQVERHKVPEALIKANGMISATNLIVRRRFRPGPTIALNAHGDVVPPGTGWTRDPYGAEIVDGWLYGRGAAVSKSDIATYAFAMLALDKCSAALNGAVELHITYDEEAGGEIGPRYLLETGLSRPDLAIGAGFSSTRTMARFTWRSRSLAARLTPPAPRPASTRSKRQTQSCPRFMAGAAGCRRGPRR
jgi:succinyl-diaminopimelate desuccinylase